MIPDPYTLLQYFLKRLIQCIKLPRDNKRWVLEGDRKIVWAGRELYSFSYGLRVFAVTVVVELTGDAFIQVCSLEIYPDSSLGRRGMTAGITVT